MSDQMFYSVSQVAALLGVAKITVYRRVWAGELPAVKVGTRVRIHENALANLIRPVTPPAANNGEADAYTPNV